MPRWRSRAKGGWDATRVLDARHHRVFVARDDGPAGYVALRSESDICVVAVRDRAAASVLRIAVESDNSAARSFYRRAGFVPVERELFELDLGRPTPRLI